MREKVSVFVAVKYTQLIRSVAGISCGGSVTNIKIMGFFYPLFFNTPTTLLSLVEQSAFLRKLYSQGNYVLSTLSV